MKTIERVAICFWSLVAIALFVSFTVWANVHSNAQDRAAERYETCVWAQYGMHPVAWYDLHGEYPPCYE